MTEVEVIGLTSTADLGFATRMGGEEVVPCLTVDVEDWYEGMHFLGHDVLPPANREPGLAALARVLRGQAPRITLFVVGRHASAARHELRALAGDGHEIACHGPDHGRLPSGGIELDDWLRRGREMVEDAVNVSVKGFRAPRFEVPGNLNLAMFRDAIARAGFTYTSDAARLGAGAAVAELPIARLGRFQLGGGSYQRLIPRRATEMLLRLHSRPSRPSVAYYHSYDFGRELPPLGDARSVAVASQIFGRNYIPAIFTFLLARLGSRTCLEAVNGLR